MHRLSRRDFLKLSALIPISTAISPWVKNLVSPRKVGQDNFPTNVIIILFDAMSARNLPVYGYPRNTSPNFNSIRGPGKCLSLAQLRRKFYSPGHNVAFDGLVSMDASSPQ